MMADEIELSDKEIITNNDKVNKNDDTFINMTNQIQENPLHKKTSKEKTLILQGEEEAILSTLQRVLQDQGHF